MAETEITKRWTPLTDFCRTFWCEKIKLVVSTIVVNLLVVVVFVGVANDYCSLKIPAIANFILLFAALTLLAYCEALHYAVVAIEKWDMAQYTEIFPQACKLHKLIDTPVKVKKFLVGRQFFTIFVVFLISQISSFPDIPKDFGGLPATMVLVLFQVGLPGVALVLTYGQLISQIYVEEFTLQFLNMYGSEFVVRLSLGAEFIGVCHFSWLLYYVVAYLTCRSVRKAQAEITAGERASTRSTDAILDADAGALSPTELNRGPDFDKGVDNGIDGERPFNWWDLFRYTWSTVATLGSLFIIFYGISIQAYVLPTPPGGTYIVFFIFLVLLFYLEGLMIAIVATQFWDKESFKEAYPRAYMLHELVNRPDNVKRFIIGRQFCTVLANFMLGQVTHMHAFPSDGYNPIGFYIIVKSGLVGVLVVLAFAQLMPELLAAEYPLRFMNLPGCYSVLCISLIFDAIGVGHCAWTIYFVTRQFCCKAYIAENKAELANTKPAIVRVNSAEVLAYNNASQKKNAGSNKV